MADEQTKTGTPSTGIMPAIGTQCVHKEDKAASRGPVWSVTAQDIPKQEVKLGFAQDHKMNKGIEPTTRTVTVPDFNANYEQL